ARRARLVGRATSRGRRRRAPGEPGALAVEGRRLPDADAAVVLADDDDEVLGDEEALDGLLARAAERGLADVAAGDLAVRRDPPEGGVAGPRCRVGAADEPAAARHGGRGRRPLLAGAP